MASFTDNFGRTISGAGGIYTTPGGPSVQAISDAAALNTFNGMAPPGWTPPNTATNASTAAAQFASLIAGGLTIISTGSPSISGTYALDVQSLQRLHLIMLQIVNTGTYSGANTWGLQSGGVATFTSIVQFKNVYNAISAFVNAASAARDLNAAGTSTAYPSASVTIA